MTIPMRRDRTLVDTAARDMWGPAVEDREFCRRILPHVSRTFALSISFLPEQLGYTVTLAYLLCRIADTIEDDASRTADEKRHLLRHLADVLDQQATDAEAFTEAFASWRGAEEGLTASAGRVLREFARLTPEERNAIAPWVRQMCDGMAETAGLLATQGGERLLSLPTRETLRRYCYYVAGTVGHLLTELFAAWYPTLRPGAEDLHRLGEGFGLGLQMTNIIKDIRDDRERGVSFVPEELCRAHGISVEQFGTPQAREPGRAVVADLVTEARGWLEDGLAYCLRLPIGAYGVRRFCLSALFLARRTLRRIECTTEFPHDVPRLKISRAEVRRTVLTTTLVAPVNPLVRVYFRML